MAESEKLVRCKKGRRVSVIRLQVWFSGSEVDCLVRWSLNRVDYFKFFTGIGETSRMKLSVLHWLNVHKRVSASSTAK